MGRNSMRSRVLLALLVACEAAVALEEIPKHRAKQVEDAAPSKPRAVPRKPRRVLIFVTPEHLMEKDPHKGYNIPYAVHAMKTLGAKSGAFEPVVSQDVAVFFPETLKTFDALVLPNTSGSWTVPAADAMERLKAHGADPVAVGAAVRKSLTDWLTSGGGIVAFHFAVGANRDWPEYKDILGASYSGHPWNEEVGIKVEEPDHPCLAAFQGKDFRLAEEVFQFREPYDRSRLRVLLSLDTANTNMSVKWIERKDNDFALAWVRAQGKGRVFYTALGHRTEIFWTPMFLQFYLDAIQFAVGDFDAPVEPREKK